MLERLMVPVFEGEAPTVSEAVGEVDTVELPETVLLGVKEAVGVPLGVGVAVGVGEGVLEAVALLE